ncbi:MAG: sugar phosphate isomerase/epimerase [Deltaproteobacteria bacterium]|nr:sugar phosphate isomerase/epimerase [Deltaproteobacteria bacterium]MBW2141825.1 sugar phosphate isomerase/epimerase [Deltaproteobacteria bacterium]
MIQIAARTRGLEAAKTILSQRFNILEITLPCPGGIEELTAWEELAQQHELILLGHGPEEGNPKDLSQLEKIYLPKLRQALEQANKLGVSLLTIHLWLDPRWMKSEIIRDKIELLARVVDWGEELGVQIDLENLSETWSDLVPPLKRCAELGLTLDLGHAMLMRPSNTAPDIILNLYDRIKHLHFHDNHGGATPRDDLHLFPGQGKVPFSRIFKLLKERHYNRTATLELEPAEMASAREWVLKLWQGL